jgi:glycogen synthase
MADGRCFTLNSSAQLTNNYIMQQNGVALEDNYSYRQLLQKQGPELLNKIQEQSRPAVIHATDTPTCPRPIRRCDKFS